MKTYYVGMDVHGASIVIVVLNGAGKMVMQGVIETGAELVRASGTDVESLPATGDCCGANETWKVNCFITNNIKVRIFPVYFFLVRL
ncbi:MAG TPA: hypothetical protein VIF64_12360 [Pyrinomonadaceae bacterium]